MWFFMHRIGKFLLFCIRGGSIFFLPKYRSQQFNQDAMPSNAGFSEHTNFYHNPQITGLKKSLKG